MSNTLTTSVENIAKQLHEIVRLEKRNFEIDDNKWKLHYIALVEEIGNRLTIAKEDQKSQNEMRFSASALIQEGYITGLSEVLEMFTTYEEWHNLDKNEQL